MDIELHNRLFKPPNSLFNQVDIEVEKNNNMIIQQMSPYMLTITNKTPDLHKPVIPMTQNEFIPDEPAIPPPPTSKPVTLTKSHQDSKNIIIPAQRDTLFWCVYIVLHEYAEYINIHHNYSICEMNWKQSLLKDIMAVPSTIKNSNHKTTKIAVQEILSELMTDVNTTSAACLVAICAYRNINIIILNHTKLLRMEFLSGDATNETYVIYKNDNNKYSVCIEALLTANIMDIRNTSLLIENDKKPLKTIGMYKMDDLVAIAKLLGIHTYDKKYKKSEIYALIGDVVKPLGV